MYQLDWAQEKLYKTDDLVNEYTSKISTHDVQYILQTVWEEHCVECAWPECYNKCSLYIERQDKACARFVNGIAPNTKFKGHYNFGADIEFRKWGKLETDLNKSFPSITTGHSIRYQYMMLSDDEKAALKDQLCNKYLVKKPYFDEFVLECYSVNKESYKLILEYFLVENGLRITKYRTCFLIKNGYNIFSIPFDNFGISQLSGHICVYPEIDFPQKRVIFTWLDFVKYKDNKFNAKERGKKIKCIAWDLDNTMWKGTLSENEKVILNKEAYDLIISLDKRGILQTIVSKNEHKLAWTKIKEFGLDKYFLYPAINWGQKSENLKQISENLNLSLDAFGIIDDSTFEREEVKNSLPNVKTYDESEIKNLLTYKEFDVPITKESKARRLSYLKEMKRRILKSSFSGSYEEFLKSCEMKINAFIPSNEQDVLRCWEIIQRTNQLNLSLNRYTLNEFNALLKSELVLCVAIKCKDKFGNYGIIGFSAFRFEKNEIHLIDFVFSCRIAQKKVEHTFLQAIANKLQLGNLDSLNIHLCKTKKNSVLHRIFTDFPLTVIFEDSHKSVMNLKMSNVADKKISIMQIDLHKSIDNFIKKITEQTKLKYTDIE